MYETWTVVVKYPLSEKEYVVYPSCTKEEAEKRHRERQKAYPESKYRVVRLEEHNGPSGMAPFRMA